MSGNVHDVGHGISSIMPSGHAAAQCGDLLAQGLVWVCASCSFGLCRLLHVRFVSSDLSCLLMCQEAWLKNRENLLRIIDRKFRKKRDLADALGVLYTKLADRCTDDLYGRHLCPKRGTMRDCPVRIALKNRGALPGEGGDR